MNTVTHADVIQAFPGTPPTGTPSFFAGTVRSPAHRPRTITRSAPRGPSSRRAIISALMSAATLTPMLGPRS